MFDKTANVMQCHLAQASIAIAREQGFSFQIDWWTCIPEPLSPNMGLGMKM